MFPADEDNVDDAHHRIPGIPGRHRAPVLDNPRAAMEALDLLVRAEDSDSSDVKSSSLVILVGGDARDLGVQVGQVVRGGGLVSPGPGGEGGVVLGAQQEAGAGPRAELPGVEDRSHHHHLLLRPGLRAVIVIAAGLYEADAAVPGGGNSLASPLQSLSKSAKINPTQMMFCCYMCH